VFAPKATNVQSPRRDIQPIVMRRSSSQRGDTAAAPAPHTTDQGVAWGLTSMPLAPPEQAAPLIVGAANDPLEQEADRVADQVMSQAGNA
jgi:hypothetical protein